jgi:hypothetical protein
VILDQRVAGMAEIPGGASGLLVRGCKGSEGDRLITRTAPGVVTLVAELRGHERQAAEELGQLNAMVCSRARTAGSTFRRHHRAQDQFPQFPRGGAAKALGSAARRPRDD